jgi:cell division transport system permease protein
MSQEKKFKRKKRLGSYPYVSVVFSISLALFAIGIFALLLLTSFKLRREIESNVEIQVYLSKTVTESERTKVLSLLTDKAYILNRDAANITFISKEDAARDFIKETGEDFISFLGENPLRDAFSIRIDPSYHTNEQMAAIKADLERVSGIFEVVYTENLVQSIKENITKISLILLSVALLLLIVTVILINNTIKLALFSQRFLIRSMQLVGANAGFVQWPFLQRSILHGLLAGIISAGGLLGLIYYANQKIEGLQEFQQLDELAMLIGGLIVLGILIAFFSTFKSIRKYLNMSLDELY